MKKTSIYNYQFVISHIPKKDGNEYIIEFPDLPGCISDGGTLEEAMENGQDAVSCWIEAAKKVGKNIPKPRRKKT